jgi:uncharacterized protein (TIGR03083 family)
MSDGDDLTPGLSAMYDTWTSILALAESLAPDELALPTRCPGWDVHDQIAHIASLEELLAGGELAPEAPDAPHIRNPVGERVERGVHAMRGLPSDQLVARLRTAIEARKAALQANPPKAGDELLGVMGNPVPAERFLPIRVFDLFVHEQDIRVATGRPGSDAGPGAQVSRDVILGMVPMWWAKEAGAQPGQTLVLRVSGGLDFERTVLVGEDGRAAYIEDIPGGAQPTAVIEITWADLVARTNGRMGAADSPVVLHGDQELAQAVVDALPMSP